MSKTKTIALWLLQVLLTLPFLAASIPKLTGSPGWVARFKGYGYPEKFYLLIGAIELLGAVSLLIPTFAAYGATALITVMMGATVTHLRYSEGPRAAVTLALILLLAIVAYARRPGFIRRKGQSETGG